MSVTKSEIESADKYYYEISSYSLLTREEEVKLAKLIRRGGKKKKEAEERLILSNLRLVYKIANEYASKCYGFTLDLSDLINEGNIGLIESIERFDPDRGTRFSTYSSYWIKQRIRKCLSNKGRTIRLPVHVYEKFSKISKFVDKYVEENGEKPSTKEVEKGTKVSNVIVNTFLNTNITCPVSLDETISPASGDSEVKRSEVIADVRILSPSDSVEKDDGYRVLAKCMSILNEREQDILQRRFGFNEENEETLESVGKKHGITRERVRQIQVAALGKLKLELNEMNKTVVLSNN